MDATFALSFSRGTKEWSIFTGPDPRIVRFNFNSGGVSSDIAWWTWWLVFPIFFSKKTVSAIQTIDSPPMFMKKNSEGHLVVDGSGGQKGFVSPIDGFSSFLKKDGKGYQPKPLTVTFELNEPGVNPDTFDAEFTPVTVTKTFGNIPMIAVVDDEFNVYFVEEDDEGGGIRMSGSSIESINLKMINKPSAPKPKTGRRKEPAFTNRKWTKFKSCMAERIAFLAHGEDPYDEGQSYGNYSDTADFHGEGSSNPISGEQHSINHEYTQDGPENEIGEPEWKQGDNKFGVTRSGEAIMRATANAAYLIGQTIESADLYYNGQKVGDYLLPTQNCSTGGNIEYILHTTSKYRYKKALYCNWGYEDAGTGVPGEITNTLLGKKVTLRLSNQNGENSPYENISDDGVEDGNDDEKEYGDPYWPVRFGEDGTLGARDPGPCGDGNIEIFIVAEEDLYFPGDDDDEIPESGTANRFEIVWKQSLDDGLPYAELGVAYDFGEGSKWEQQDIGNSITSTKVFDFPQFYIVDMRQLADDIAAACGASGPAELLMDLPGFEEPFDENIQEMMSCLEAFMKHFNSEDEDDEGVPEGMLPRLKYQLANGILPGQISVEDAVSQYEVLRQCVEDQIDKSCKFVVNPLNTGFKLLGDTDETPLPDYIDPEQADPGALGAAGIVDELEFDEDLDGFPSITGAMEYASGIGDTIVAEVGTKAIVEFLPRDCYDEPMPLALDMTDKFVIEFVSDETGSAAIVPPDPASEDLVLREEERYLMAIETDTPGKVVIRGSVCDVVIQAVTDRGIMDGMNEAASADETASATSLEGCIDDADGDGSGTEDASGGDNFAPGALAKVDRNLTILFVPAGAAGLGDDGSGGPGGLYGDGDRDASARSAKPNPQVSGTKLEN